ncbi:YIP1 family protein [Halovenus halobia]|uniref:YIP1 family protein n=1 Tax=Halovenus halobia TaxID=3396622 RepID=UPI003F56D79F
MSPRTPILDPYGYFRRENRPSLKIAAGVLTLEAVLTSVIVWWFLKRTFAQIDLSAAEREAVGSAISGIFPALFAAVFFGWVLAGAIFHAFMWFAGAERGFGHTLAVVGEASMVSIALMPLVLGGFILVVGRVPSDPNTASEFIRQTANQQTGVLLIVGFIRVLWVGVVQAVGLSEVHDITLGRTVLMAVGLGLLGFLLG